MQLRVVTWSRSAESGDEEPAELIQALARHRADAALLQRVPRSWPRAVAAALAAEYRQTPADRGPRWLARVGRNRRGRRSAPGDAVTVVACHDRVIDARAGSLPLIAVRVAYGPWLVSADAGRGEVAVPVQSLLELAGDSPVVLALASDESPPPVGALRHVAPHPGGHVFLAGAADVVTVSHARAGHSSALIVDLRV